MNYELAKRLKDAGFPQPDFEDDPFDERLVCQHEPKGGSHTPGKVYTRDCCDFAYIPSLSELIAACGENFEELGHLPSDKGEFRWYASTTAIGDYERYYGSTPEEAVAALWLALKG